MDTSIDVPKLMQRRVSYNGYIFKNWKSKKQVTDKLALSYSL